MSFQAQGAASRAQSLKTLALAPDSNWVHPAKFTSGTGFVPDDSSAPTFASNRLKS